MTDDDECEGHLEGDFEADWGFEVDWGFETGDSNAIGFGRGWVVDEKVGWPADLDAD
jgi:hypothetical protein